MLFIIKEVECSYQGKKRYIGTYVSQDQATVANEVSRGMLKATNDSTLTDEEIELNVSQAKTAALKAVNQYQGRSHNFAAFSEDRPLVEETAHRQTLLEHESNCSGPSLVLGRWQTDEVRIILCI